MSLSPALASTLLALLLGLALLVGAVQAWRQRRGARWLSVSLALQLAIGAVLWQLLQSPPPAATAQPLIVLNSGHALSLVDGLPQLPALQPSLPEPLVDPADWPRVALPEAADLPSGLAHAVPDLATALRRWPAQRLILLGEGLSARDLEAVGALPLHWAPPAEPTGVVELRPPPTAVPGRQWQLSGQLAVPADQDPRLWSLRLLDPAGAELQRVQVATDGAFRLGARTPVVGRHEYRLEWLDPTGQPVGALPVPVQIRTAPAPRLALLVGAPSAESKFLRRWASDAGLLSSFRSELRPGLSLRSGPAEPPRSAADWTAVDLLLLEDRVWLGWSAAQRTALLEAVDGGLGLLLRLTGPVNGNTQAKLAELGFAVTEADLGRQVRLPSSAPCPVAPTAVAAVETTTICRDLGQLDLQRRPLRVQAPLSQPLLSSADGEPLGLWRNQGQGRIGLLWLGDSHRIALAVGAAEYADLWAGIAARLARPRGGGEGDAAAMVATLPKAAQQLAWAGERQLWCGPRTMVIDPQGQRSRLWPDSARADCRGWWPRRAGWHGLLSEASATSQASVAGDADLDASADSGSGSTATDGDWHYVWSPERAPSLYLAEQRRRTQALAAANALSPTPVSAPPIPDLRWAWWIALWTLLALLWGWERRKGLF